MITTILILLPLAAAVALWITPWRSSRSAAGFALLVALAELALWVGTALNFDFGATGLQEEADVTWFSDLDVAYKVGLYDYSLWLVGLTALVTAVAVGYGLWAGRERLGVYLSLLLFLEGATIGVFAAQDLILFYVFWEAMLIPLYVLIGVWGGPGRLGATYKFVAYTVTGSLLMLVAIVAAGLGAGTFDIAELVGRGTSTWVFLGFAIAFAVKAPLWPFHGWLPDAYSGCDDLKPYQSAKEVPPLRVPAGADLPDTRNALKIPEVKTPAVPLEEGSCLDHPPPYGKDRPQPPKAS